MALFAKSEKRESPSPEKDRARDEARVTYLGPLVKIHGELNAEEDLTVDGRVEGRITAARTLHVGPKASVEAEIAAQVVVIAGRVTGDVGASERVELLASGHLEGNIRAPRIVIAEGATFKGSVEMGEEEKSTS